MLLLGVPGTGKSAFAKALGNEVGRPTILLDLGKLKGGLVGQTEERTRQALRILSATRPNIAFADEIEKGLAGVQQSGASDSGVSAGQFGTLLSHMADHAGDSFFVFTANDITKLPPEFTRAGRLNAIFFVDLPGPAEQERIWQIHLAQVRARPGPAPPRRPRVVRRRDRDLLRDGRPARHQPDGGGAVHRPGGGHRGRVDRAAPDLGQRPLPGGRPARPLHPRHATSPPSPAARSTAIRRPTDPTSPGIVGGSSGSCRTSHPVARNRPHNSQQFAEFVGTVRSVEFCELCDECEPFERPSLFRRFP